MLQTHPLSGSNSVAFINLSRLIFIFSLFNMSVFVNQAVAASFDCTKAATKIEKLICNTPELSQLDDDLWVAYNNNMFDIWGPEEAAYKQQQRNWLKTVRNRCATIDCLAEVYQERLWALNGTKEPLPLFSLRRNHDFGSGVCEAYLNVLNNTPKEALLPCKLPDLTHSNFSAVKFETLHGDELKLMDQKFSAPNPNKPGAITKWKNDWPAHKQDYETGYNVIGAATLDLDSDGQLDKVLNHSRPEYSCQVFEGVSATYRTIIYEERWNNLNKEDHKKLTNTYGYRHLFYIVNNSDVNFIDSSGHLVNYNNSFYIIDHHHLNTKNIKNPNGDKTYVTLSVIKPDFRTKNICNYWYNY